MVTKFEETSRSEPCIMAAQQALFNSPPDISMSNPKFSEPLTTNEGVEMLENQLKKQTDSKRVRVAEYFSDFDPLRSGSITKDQFRRSMDHHLGIPLSDRECELIASKYGSCSNRVNYRQFVDKIEKGFDSRNFSQNYDPMNEMDARQKETPPQFDDTTKRLVQTCSQYYKNRGIKVKVCYQDFDRHKMGYITLSQFHRSFPGPPEIKETEISLIAQYYLEPSTGLYNYLRFDSDIEVFQENEQRRNNITTHPDFSQKGKVRTLEKIFQCIRDIVYKNGIRTTEFFCDHDKLRTGIVTENQFVCGLSLCLGRRIQLNREEIQKIVVHYQLSDGRIRYKDFCDLMENAYNDPTFEQNPTLQITRPLQGQLHKTLNSLSNDEERQLEEVIVQLRREVRKRRLLLYPYFKDFDRSRGYTRGVSKSQFKRVLDFSGLPVTLNEFKLIAEKFKDPVGGDVNYSAFIQAIDEEYTGHITEEEVKQQTTSCNDDIQLPIDETADVEQIIAHIQNHVVVNRIRTCEHFQDFDPLRSGAISSSKFRLGLSSLGYPNLSITHFKVMCEKYDHPKLRGSIAWKMFLSDIDKAFREWPETLSHGNTEQITSPTQQQQQQQQQQQPVDEILSNAMQRIQQRINQRRVSVKPCFQDFDRHNMGYMTKSQFRQCLSYLELPATDEEMLAIEDRFSNDKGFNYLQFLHELQPTVPLEKKYDQRLETLTKDKLKLEKILSETPTNLESLANGVMNKIKIKVSKERMRVLEFMTDYDKLRSGRIPVQSFIRALDLSGLKLDMREAKAIVEKYRSKKDPAFVEYNQFSDEIESIFTVKELEKMPTAQVEPFVPPEEVDLNQLSPEQDQILMKCIHRLAERVRVRCIQLFPLFEDYDCVHIGSVSTSQFRRVLNELELSGLLSDLEFNIIFNKFAIKVGGRTDVYYIAFCSMVEDYSQNRWTDPDLK